MTSRNESNGTNAGSRLRALGLYAAFAAALGAAAIGCAMDASGGAASSGGAEPAVAVAHAADGEALLRGVFFGQGEVASRLPELWGDADASASDPAAIDELMARVRTSGPGSIDSFGREVSSGDAVRIRAALVDMRDRLFESRPDKGAPTEEAKCIVIADAVVVGSVFRVIFLDPRGNPIWAKGGLSEDDITALIADRLSAQPQ